MDNYIFILQSFCIRIISLATFFSFIEVIALVPFNFGSFLLLGQLEVAGILKVLRLPLGWCRSRMLVC